MRRGPGISGLKKKEERNSRLALEATKIDEVQMSAVIEQGKVFKEKLEQFALKHKKDINKDPVLRKRFHDMCQSVGVDPLASNKGIWSQLLGVGDFYYELAVQLIDICLRTRHKNGGFLEVAALKKHVNDTRPRAAAPVSEDDIERAIQKLHVLGAGFAVKTIGAPPADVKMVQSVPLELNADHSTIIQLARDSQGQVTKSLVAGKLKWDLTRIALALEFLEHEGVAWIDMGGQECAWFIPSLFPALVG